MEKLVVHSEGNYKDNSNDLISNSVTSPIKTDSESEIKL